MNLQSPKAPKIILGTAIVLAMIMVPPKSISDVVGDIGVAVCGLMLLGLFWFWGRWFLVGGVAIAGIAFSAAIGTGLIGVFFFFLVLLPLLKVTVDWAMSGPDA